MIKKKQRQINIKIESIAFWGYAYDVQTQHTKNALIIHRHKLLKCMQIVVHVLSPCPNGIGARNHAAPVGRSVKVRVYLEAKCFGKPVISMSDKRETGLVDSAPIRLCLPQLETTAKWRPDSQRTDLRTDLRQENVSFAPWRWRWQTAACTAALKWTVWIAMARSVETAGTQQKYPCRCHFPGSGLFPWREKTSTDCETESFYWRIKSAFACCL